MASSQELTWPWQSHKSTDFVNNMDFETLPTEIRNMIWKEAILDTTTRIVLVEEGFTLSPRSPLPHVPSDTARILAIRQSCKEANEAVLECVRRQHISISPVLAIQNSSPHSQPLSRFTSSLDLFPISVHKDILYLDGELIVSRIAEMMEFDRCFRAAPWSKEPADRRPTHFMLDVDSCAYLLSPGLLSLCGHYGPFQIAEAFLLALGLVPLTSTTDGAAVGVPQQYLGRYNLAAWRSLRVAPTTITVIVPVSEDDMVGAFNVTKEEMNIRTYDRAVQNRGLWVQLAATYRDRLQLGKCMMVWNMVIDSAQRLGIEFPITLQFAQRGALDPTRVYRSRF